MKFLQRLKRDSKDTFLGGLQEQLKQQALSELASGKLSSPTSLDEVCSRVLPTLRKNPITAGVLRGLKVTDEELREMLKKALTEAGIEVK